MKAMGIEQSERELKEMINKYDNNENGTIDFEEYIGLLTQYGQIKNTDEWKVDPFDDFDY